MNMAADSELAKALPLMPSAARNGTRCAAAGQSIGFHHRIGARANSVQLPLRSNGPVEGPESAAIAFSGGWRYPPGWENETRTRGPPYGLTVSVAQLWNRSAATPATEQLRRT
jgi:hypothetical protein